MIVARAFLPPQNAVHRLAKPLHGEILEGQRGSVEEFEREQVVIDLRERRSGGVTEAGIGGCGQGVHFCVIEILVDEGRHEPRSRFRIRNAPQRPDRIRRQMGNGERHVEAAVACETGEKSIREAQRRRSAARRNIIHDKRILGCLVPSANCAKVEWRGLGRRIGPKQDASGSGFALKEWRPIQISA